MTNDRIIEKLDRIEQILFLQIVPHIPEIISNAMDTFGNSIQRAKVYLAVDGESTGSKIAENLGIHQPDVADYISALARLGLLVPLKKVGRGYIYGRNHAYEMIGLLEHVKSKFNL